MVIGHSQRAINFLIANYVLIPLNNMVQIRPIIGPFYIYNHYFSCVMEFIQNAEQMNYYSDFFSFFFAFCLFFSFPVKMC